MLPVSGQPEHTKPRTGDYCVANLVVPPVQAIDLGLRFQHAGEELIDKEFLL